MADVKHLHQLAIHRKEDQEAVDGIRQGYEDVKAGRTRPAEQFRNDFARKHGLPR